MPRRLHPRLESLEDRTVPATMVAAGSAAKGTKSSGPDVQHAVAQRADYDGDTNLLTLSGGAQVTDAESVLWASRVAMRRAAASRK